MMLLLLFKVSLLLSDDMRRRLGGKGIVRRNLLLLLLLLLRSVVWRRKLLLMVLLGWRGLLLGRMFWQLVGRRLLGPVVARGRWTLPRIVAASVHLHLLHPAKKNTS